MPTTQLTSRNPVRITAEPTQPVTVTVTGATSYYAGHSKVASTDTALTDGQSATFTAPQWMISASDSLIRQTPPTYDPGVVPAGSISSAEIADNAIAQANLADAAVGKAELKVTVEDVTVLATATTGTATVVAGSIPLGIYGASNQDQLVDSVAIATTVLTVTLAAAATADNVFKVPVLEP